MERIAILLAGVALGMMIHRWIVRLSVASLNPTICDYCRYAQTPKKH